MNVNFAAFLQVAQAIAVIFAVVFGAYQVRQMRRQRRRDESFALMNSLQTREMVRALVVLDSLPAGLGKAELESRLGERFIDLQILLGTWESLGILVFHREVGLDLVDDFYSGSIVHSWLKLKRYVEELREQTGRDTRWEWFEWLAMRMIERESKSSPVPAHVQHKNWKEHRKR